MPLLIESSNTFIDNIASNEENNYGTPAVRLTKIQRDQINQRILQNTEQNSIIDNIRSGSQLSVNEVIVLVDYYGQVVKDDSSSELQINFSNELENSAQNIGAINGVFDLSLVNLKHTPGKEMSAQFFTNDIKVYEKIPVEFEQALDIELKFSECNRGDIILDDESCFQCVYGTTTFSLKANNKEQCQPCDSKIMVCHGGAEVGPQKNYWRLNETSDQFLKCPYPAACLGGEINENELLSASQCEEGYTGNLCSSCKEGWGKKSDGTKCFDCKNNPSVYITVAIAILINLVIVSLSVRSTLKMNKNHNGGHNNSANAGILLRTLMNYLQITSLIGSIEIDWPNALKINQLINDSITTVDSDIFSFDCFLNDFNEQFPIPKAYIKLILVNIIPIVFSLLVFLFWCLYFKIKGRSIRQNKKSFVSQLATSILIICFNAQPAIIKQDLGLFQCINLYREDSPEYYLYHEYDMKCWTPQHVNWSFAFALPSMIIWIFILPLFIFFVIHKNRNRLNADQIRTKYSFIYRGYKENNYY